MRSLVPVVTRLALAPLSLSAQSSTERRQSSDRKAAKTDKLGLTVLMTSAGPAESEPLWLTEDAHEQRLPVSSDHTSFLAQSPRSASRCLNAGAAFLDTGVAAMQPEQQQLFDTSSPKFAFFESPGGAQSAPQQQREAAGKRGLSVAIPDGDGKASTSSSQSSGTGSDVEMSFDGWEPLALTTFASPRHTSSGDTQAPAAAAAAAAASSGSASAAKAAAGKVGCSLANITLPAPGSGGKLDAQAAAAIVCMSRCALAEVQAEVSPGVIRTSCTCAECSRLA